MLFKKPNTPAPEIPQTAREAIVDLLHLCLFADAHISLKEGHFIADVVNVIGWDQNLTFSVYEQRSVAAARAARADETSKLAFLQHAAKRLASPAARQLAAGLCGDLVAADGTAQRESELLQQIKAVLNVG